MQILRCKPVRCSGPGEPANVSRQSGVTLLELLVVLLMIGLGLGLGLNLGNQDTAVEQQIDDLAAASVLVADEAVLSGQIFGLDFFTLDGAGGPQWGLRWLVLQEQGWQPAAAQDIAGIQPEILWPQQFVLQLEQHAVQFESRVELQGELADPLTLSSFTPEVLYYPNREVSQFTFTLTSLEGESASMSVDLLGAVRVSAHAGA